MTSKFGILIYEPYEIIEGEDLTITTIIGSDFNNIKSTIKHDDSSVSYYPKGEGEGKEEEYVGIGNPLIAFNCSSVIGGEVDNNYSITCDLI